MMKFILQWHMYVKNINYGNNLNCFSKMTFYRDYAIELLLQTKNKSEIMNLICRLPGSIEEIEKYYIKAGFQTINFYKKVDPSIDKITAIRFYALSKQHEHAAILGIEQLKSKW